jgi:hypothetical protein
MSRLSKQEQKLDVPERKAHTADEAPPAITAAPMIPWHDSIREPSGSMHKFRL